MMPLLSIQVLVSLLFDFDYDRCSWMERFQHNKSLLSTFWFTRTIVAKRNQHFLSVHRCRSSHGERFSATGVWGRSSRLGFSRSGTHGCHTGECQALSTTAVFSCPASSMPTLVTVLGTIGIDWKRLWSQKCWVRHSKWTWSLP